MLETAEDTAENAATAVAERAGEGRGRPGRYIPLRKGEVLAAVLDDPAMADAHREPVADLLRRIALIFHVEFFEARERLKDLYVRLNPDRPGEGPLPDAPEERAELMGVLDEALEAANFHRIAEDALTSETDAAGRVSAKVRVPSDIYALVRVYGRGRRRRPIEVRRWFGLKAEQVETTVYDWVALIAAMKSDLPRGAAREGRLRGGAVYLKLFRDIPQADLQTLYPNARVVMRLQDKLILGVPAVAGGVPVLLNILPALSVLLVVAGAYLGISGTVEEDAAKQALGAMSGLAALGGFLMRQWIKYERQKLKHQKQVAENAYFNNVNNNAGFFDTLIGQSEDSEVKEAALAYAHLLMAGRAMTAAELDRAIEDWLRARFSVEVDFEIDDALAKLERLHLVEEDAEGRLTARPPEEALAEADRAWIGLAEEAFNRPAAG